MFSRHIQFDHTYKNHYFAYKVLIRRIRTRYMITELATTRELVMAIGQRLRAQRLAQNVTLKQLAGMTGLSVGAVRNLETEGKSSLDTLIRVIQSLGLASELAHLFELKQQSIAQMAMATQVTRRRRASGSRTR